MWAKLDLEFMKQAPWAPFMNREIPKFVSKRVHGLVFNPSYFELFPSMWLSKSSPAPGGSRGGASGAIASRWRRGSCSS